MTFSFFYLIALLFNALLTLLHQLHYFIPETVFDYVFSQKYSANLFSFPNLCTFKVPFRDSNQ